jgi:hypothetical protein
MLLLKIIGKMALMSVGASVVWIIYLFYTSGNIYVGTTALLAYLLVALAIWDITLRLLVLGAINNINNTSKLSKGRAL